MRKQEGFHSDVDQQLFFALFLLVFYMIIVYNHFESEDLLLLVAKGTWLREKRCTKESPVKERLANPVETMR